MKSNAKLFSRTTAVLLFVTSICGQGTVQFAFEEFKVKDLPPFVTQVYPPGPGPQISMVADSVFAPPLQPFDGQKYLAAAGGIYIESPNGQPIQSFTLHLFTPPP